MIKRLLLAVVTTALLVGVAGPAHAASPRVTRDLFGMHVSTIGTGAEYPNVGVGAVRLWDTATSWRDVERERGVYDWTRLDAAVAAAEGHGASVMLVLGGTPVWYAKDPTAPSIYGAGFSSPTNDLGAWKNYVRAVATRYRGRITAYEPHNEGDILAFWSGTDAQLLTESRLAYKTIKSVDPSAIVSSPSFVDRTQGSQYAIMRYLTHGGARWADVISYHPYGMPEYGPEQNASLITYLRRKMKAAGIVKPIWSTEVNLGLPFGDVKEDTPDWSDEKQAAYVVRTYLLQHSVKVERVYWYDWSRAGFLGVKMGSDTAPASVAYALVQRWMTGHQVDRCVKDARGTYGCRIHGRGTVRWNPTRTVSYAASSRPVDSGGHFLAVGRVAVGGSPILFREGR